MQSEISWSVANARPQRQYIALAPQRRNHESVTRSPHRRPRLRLDELAVERYALTGRNVTLEGRAVSRDRERERLSQLLAWTRSDVERVDGLTTEERRTVLLELGVVVRILPTGAPERYTFELGAKRPEPGTSFEGVDWAQISAPTLAERRETEALFAEAAVRGAESEIIGVFVEGAGSADRKYPWDYWDGHVREALVQHARVLGIAPVTG